MKSVPPYNFDSAATSYSRSGAAAAAVDSLDLVGGFCNIFDEAYRIHGSGINGYGRSVWVGTQVRF